MAGTHNCQLSAHVPALPTASGAPACWQVLTIVSFKPTYQHCLQHQGPQPVGRYCQLSAHLPALPTASGTSAYWHLFVIARLPALPTASGKSAY